MKFTNLNRRRVLRGAGVAIALPFLDMFLNSNGTALAAGGAIPMRFGTWFWGCGLNPGRWEPKSVGKLTETGPELMALKPFFSKMNVYSGMNAYLDGKSMQVHRSGQQAVLAGTVENRRDGTLETIDSLIAGHIGAKTRFRSLEVACSGLASDSQSKRGGSSAPNPGEISPLALYTRIFGAEFKDPNAADFTPDPATIIRRSAISTVKEDRDDILKVVGAADKARLDEYFTSLRQIEQQLELQLEKPAPLESCVVPAQSPETKSGDEVAMSTTNHGLFAQLLTHALACGQTNVINVTYNSAISSLRRSGKAQSHHESTHDEAVDPKLGYQPDVTFYLNTIIDNLAVMVKTLDSIKEGDGTLLDRMILMTATDHGYAKVHGIENMPLLTFGKAGGHMKTGIHAAAPGDPVTRVGLTVQQAMGMSVGTWGTQSNMTSKPFSEVLV